MIVCSNRVRAVGSIVPYLGRLCCHTGTTNGVLCTHIVQMVQLRYRREHQPYKRERSANRSKNDCSWDTNPLAKHAIERGAKQGRAQAQAHGALNCHVSAELTRPSWVGLRLYATTN
jgi:hypothetical protein